MKLTEGALKRPVSTFMIFLSLVVIGIITSRLLPLEFFPEVEFPFINISAPYPNSTPEEVERQITRPMEEVLATMSNIKRMNSRSNENGVDIGIRFKWGTDANLKGIEAKEKLDAIRNQLPSDFERYYIRHHNPNDQPVLMIRISSDRDLSNAYDMLNRLLKRRIERINGVSRATLYGVEKKEVNIQLLADRIKAHKVDLNHLSQVLSTSNFMVPSGKITDGNKRFQVRPIGNIKNPEQIGDLIVGQHNLRLKDIATIKYDTPELNYARHLNRKYAIGMDIFKESGANVVRVGDRIKDEIKEISRHPKMKGITLYLMQDNAESILSSLRELLKSGMIGALLAIVILFIFLRQWLTTLIVALAVPVCLLVTVAFMYFFNMSLNILSMLGLLLAVGMLVDNAVVVTENIYRHQKIGIDKKNATLHAVKEVALAITAGTITTIIVFLPNMVADTDVTSMYIKHVATTFSIALIISLILAQTVVPFLTTRIKTQATIQGGTIIDRLVKRYEKVLTWLMTHRKSSVLLILLTLASVMVPVRMVKTDMFPPQEDRKLYLRYHINDNYTLDKVKAVVDKAENYLYESKETFEIDSVYTYYTGDYAQSTINLYRDHRAKKHQEDIKNEIRANLPVIPLGKLSFERRGSMGAGENLRVYLNGPSTEQLIHLSKQVEWLLEKIPGFKDVRSAASTGKKEVQVVVDRHRAKMAGFTPAEIARHIAVGIRGINLRRLQTPEGEIIVKVEFQKDDRKSLHNLKDLTLFKNNQSIKLSALADFKLRQGPPSIRRENRQTSLGINIDLKDVTISEARQKISKVMKEMQFPPGYAWSFGRSFSHEDETIKTMAINTGLALILIYFVMASLFESLVLPAAIWTSIIFAIVGVWWFFLFTGTTFDLMAWFGVLILIGVVVNNGIVLIDYINQLRSQGTPRIEAIIKAGCHRLRPILMTAGTTVLSLLPLCITQLQIGGDGPPYFPMARAIVGGLTFSTFVTLIILPTIYILLDNLRNHSRRIIKRVKA